MTDEHLPGCAALRCQFPSCPIGRVTHESLEDTIILEATKLGNRTLAIDKVCERYEWVKRVDPEHAFQPGPCNCLIGELRAEIEELHRQMDQGWNVPDYHTEKVEVPNAEDLVKELIRLRAEVERLKKVIEKAPHDASCSRRWRRNLDDYEVQECDCWKSEAVK